MTGGLRIAFFGSSLVSSYWNGSCTYYRGIVRGLHERGHRVSFYEPDAFERQRHRDIPDPPWARVVVYPGTPETARRVVQEARDADVVVKTSGVGVGDAELERAVIELPGSATRIFWDVDAPATLTALERGENGSLRRLIPAFDLVLTYGGGVPVVERYAALGAQECVPVYNALDPLTHHPAPPDPAFKADLVFLGNRLPDREARVHEFFLRAAELLPERSFLLGGSGWGEVRLPANVRYVGHVSTEAHNAVNSTPLAVLNVSRDSMATNGFSPATRVFEAAGAGACLITDAWEGIGEFLFPGHEVLVAADGTEVAATLDGLTSARAAEIGAAARERILAEHTYADRAAQVDAILASSLSGSRA